MNKRMISLMAAALALLSAGGQVEFTGVGEHPIINVTPDINTGLDMIYVVYDTDGVGMTYSSTSGMPAVWYSFDSRGGGFAEVITGITYAGAVSTLPQVLPNKGYIIEEGTDRYYCWVVNYADYYLSLNDMFIVNDNPCSLLTLNVDGEGRRIQYYDINGHSQMLDREIKLSYNTLVWDDSTYWQETPMVETFESLADGIQIEPPLCNTELVLSGDVFLEQWGLGEAIEGTYFQTQAVDCGSSAVQEDNGNDNDKGKGDGLGGSAPAHIVFTGYPTDAVVYRIWEMATDPDFLNVILQYNQDEVDYVFNDAGNYYMRYRVANADGSCEAYGDTYIINVSESWLPDQKECPNVFSPGSTEGVNDVWKLPYKSIVEFHCWIFNRWGTLVYEYTDPGGGWDGTHNGKLVDTGVYYYVVEARGSDGQSYKRRGDITILRYKKGVAGGSNSATGGGSED